MEYDIDTEEGFSGLPMAAPPLPAVQPQAQASPPQQSLPPFPPPPLPRPMAAAPQQFLSPMIPPDQSFPQRRFIAMGDTAAPAKESGHMLGLALLLTGIGGAIGATYAGLYGGFAGGIGMGSMLNGARAYSSFKKGTAADDREATVSLTYSVIGLATAGYLLYRGLKTVKPNESPRRVSDDETIEGVE